MRVIRNLASARARAVVAVIGTSCLTLALGACGVRVDTPPPAIPSPGTEEVARQAAAETAGTIADLAAAVPDPDEALGLLLADVVAASAEHVEALGGVWEAPPRPTTSPASPEPTPTAPAGSSPEDVLAALVAGAEEARTQALAVDDGDLTTLLASILLWRTVAAHDVADLLGSDAAAELTGGLDRTSLGLTSFPGGTDLVRAVDAAAYAYEVLAARAEGDVVATWAGRGRELRDTAEAVALGSGLAGTAGDPREAAYDVAALAEVEPLAAVTAVENDLIMTWVAASSTVPEQGRTLALDAAVDAATTARTWLLAQGVTGLAGLGALPGLPA
ncbi:hypothetical protein Bcav_2493 [Beutenbergia cavernae DSM 12333]|uniref:DUF4439 domain-containing protein n=1 Tax=Beutenbergia cavernae (strain ATCC BAA-8 / DSM 12333 / CCUG 43141 / JCM 11478 / NBRC 16432 / NCIMB 13614 / HKI 0122) TaxID=471853 RepID=C5BWS7_BEUC1|nr:DUF4439 domain-containing protein [Beutenbergia cavernae]ACQ80743.1 hypothetical protein Bcav_2493 [Beutenbergia cavernae DSM 12333]